MDKLFEDKERVDTSPARHIDNTFDFLDRSVIEEIAGIRIILNEWYSNYPKEEKAELKKRLLTSFAPTFYELFLHELFSRQGFNLKLHPTISGTDRKPDFLASKDGLEFYIEANDSADKSQAEIGLDNKMNSVYDGLNKINSPNFLLKIRELQLKSLRQPSLKKVKIHIEKELSQLNPDVIAAIVTQGGWDAAPVIAHEDDDLKIVVSPIPVIPSARGNMKGRPIGMYPIQSFIGGADESIRTALERKATRYGTLNKPYLICVNSSNGMGANEYSVMNALFGSLAVTWSLDPNKRDERLERGRDGFFLGAKGSQFTRVSGVLITNIHLGNLRDANHWLVKHPFASKDLDFTKFDLTYIAVESRKIVTNARKNLADFI